MTFTITARRLALLFSCAVGLLVLIHMVLQVVRYSTGDHRLMGSLALFSRGAEQAIPAYYSALAILCSSILLAIIAIGEKRRGESVSLCWFGLSLIFLFLYALASYAQMCFGAIEVQLSAGNSEA